MVRPRQPNRSPLLTSTLAIGFLFFTGVACENIHAEEPSNKTDTRFANQPNIVVILADDLGFGDVQPNNSASKINTPNFNQLAKQGVNFTDAHSGSAVCTPTRYGLLCGRYCWRTRLKKGVLGGYSKPLIKLDQQTVGSILKSNGYYTGCVGKWHLGLGWQWKDAAPSDINNFGLAGGKQMVDFTKPVTDGPLQHGFDESFIIPASLDMSPYVFIKNDRVTSTNTSNIDGVKFPKFYRKGEVSEDFKHVGCLSRLASEAVGFINRRKDSDKPFFLYFPMPAPHKPVIPEPEFQRKSGIGPYGDFVQQVDATVGKVIDAIDEAGIADNTLLIVTSDNGSFMFSYKNDAPDHTSNENIQGYAQNNHRSNGPLRGTKADVWEAGHRVPFFVRWPGKITGNRKVGTTICLTDILATAAQVSGTEFDQKQSPDSFSFWAFTQEAGAGEPTPRPAVINHSVGGMFAIRDGKWKLVFGDGSGGRQKPRGKNFGRPFQLFDLDSDLGETKNVAADNADVVQRMIESFKKLAPEPAGEIK